MAARPRFNPVTHIIFDNDGTLMDTVNLYQNIVTSILDKYGKTFTNEMRIRYLGMPASQVAVSMVKENNLPMSPKEFINIVVNLVKESAENVKLLPGVKDFLLHLHDHRIQIAIATSSTKATFEMKASPHSNLMPVFHHIVCGDDPELKCGRGKPKPDIFLLAASRFTPPPKRENCLVFEDSPIGLKAGIAAGMQVIFIPDPSVPLELRTGATQVLKSMADFKPEDFGLPPYDGCSKFEFG